MKGMNVLFTTDCCVCWNELGLLVDTNRPDLDVDAGEEELWRRWRIEELLLSFDLF